MYQLDANGNGPRVAGDIARCRAVVPCDHPSFQGNQGLCPEIKATNFFYAETAITFTADDENKIQSATGRDGVSYAGQTAVTIWGPDEILVLSEDQFTSSLGPDYTEFKKKLFCYQSASLHQSGHLFH